MQIRVCSYNCDFALNAGQWRADFATLAPYADVLLVQEAKSLDLQQYLPFGEWAVWQDTSSPARAGSAIAWRRDMFALTGGGFVKGVGPGSARMLTRYIAWANLKPLGARTRLVRFVSGHAPPARYSWLQGPFYSSVRALVARTRPWRVMVIGGDWNMPTWRDPAKLRGRRFRLAGHGIDGLYVRGAVIQGSARLGPDTGSDHRPVLAVLNIK